MILITYDVHERHEQIRATLKEANWKATIKGEDRNGLQAYVNLPETTFYKEDISSSQAMIEFENIAGGAENIIRYFGAEFNDWTATKGAPLPSEMKTISLKGFRSLN